MAAGIQVSRIFRVLEEREDRRGKVTSQYLVERENSSQLLGSLVFFPCSFDLSLCLNGVTELAKAVVNCPSLMQIVNQ